MDPPLPHFPRRGEAVGPAAVPAVLGVPLLPAPGAAQGPTAAPGPRQLRPRHHTLHPRLHGGVYRGTQVPRQYSGAGGETGLQLREDPVERNPDGLSSRGAEYTWDRSNVSFHW